MSLPPLSAEDFPAFFEVANSYPPFRWQVRFARDVISSGKWPNQVALPTAAGKTSLIDIAIFALACQAHLPHGERTVPLRVFFVIDRRVVVDAALQHAVELSKLFEDTLKGTQTKSVLHRVAKRLGHLAGSNGLPLFASVMRGGMLLDASWTRSATQPTVCVSTVDQFGSRLLFRGYGVTQNQRPIHAALTGCDSLVIVDEAHLSQPFCQTLRSVQRYAKRASEFLAKPLTLVEMTATPVEEKERFCLEPQDFPEPELERRLSAEKLTKLESVADAENATARTALVRKAIECAEKLAEGEPKVIGIVVNRVLTARRIFEELHESKGDKLLLIGRVRPLDRDRLWSKWKEQLVSDPKQRRPAERHVFVVSTQTIEVGADLDFDALITELAPIDSLRQRFGRLNRRGIRSTTDAVIISTKDQLAARYDDPVYKGTLAPTWKWLKNQEERRGKSKVVNFSVNNITERLNATAQQEREALTLPVEFAPVLLPAQVDAYSQTSVPPRPETEIAIFLHGLKPPEAEVRVIWRADLLGFPKDWKTELNEKQREQIQAWPEIVGAARPSSLEAMSLPLPTAIRWLQQRSSIALTDLASGGDAEPERDITMRPAVAWRGIRECKLVNYPREIRPGDTLVVPSSYGGADEFGWIGQRGASADVPDLAEEAATRRGRAKILRLHPAVLESLQLPNQKERIEEFLNDETRDAATDLLPQLITAADESNASPVLRELLLHFASLGKRLREPVRPERYNGLILRDATLLQRGTFLELEDDVEEATQTSDVALDAHLKGTAEMARKISRHAGLSDELANDYALAGELHDLGKADPRFQVMLYGREVVVNGNGDNSKLLAKSARRFDTRAESRRLRWLAHYPDGARHETLSVSLALAEENKLSAAQERDLILHFIAAHHGWARPFLRTVQESEEDREEVDLTPIGFHYTGIADYSASMIGSEVADRFWRLSRRYGWWGLAWLETLFRLSDYEESAETTPKETPSA